MRITPFFLLMHIAGACTAVSDSLLVTDSASIPPIRVRTSDALMQMDSLWIDTLWSWTGPCENDVRLFRFEYGDSLYRSVNVPCARSEAILVQSTPSSLYEVAASTSDSPPRSGAIQLTREDLLKIRSKSLEQSCYPPLSQAKFQRFINEMSATIFESDKCDLLASCSHESCLTSSQIHTALLLIPSEDRRLQTMKNHFSQPRFWRRKDLESLFQLKFIFEQALESFETY